MYVRIEDCTDENSLQIAFTNLNDWSNRHKLNINETKSTVMTFCRVVTMDWGAEYSINNEPLEQVDTFSCLGIFGKKWSFVKLNTLVKFPVAAYDWQLQQLVCRSTLVAAN